jgi:hypothetical protein
VTGEGLHQSEMQKAVTDLTPPKYQSEAVWDQDKFFTGRTFPAPEAPQTKTPDSLWAALKFNGAGSKYIPARRPHCLLIRQTLPKTPDVLPGASDWAIKNFRLHLLGNKFYTTGEVRKEMDLTNYFQTGFVSVKTCKLYDVFILDTPPEETVKIFEGEEKKQVQCQVTRESDQTVFTMGFNRTNLKNLAESYGMYTEAWVGKKVKLVAKTKYPNGSEGYIYGPA